MNSVRLTRRGWIVLIGAVVLLSVAINTALSGKCWNNNGVGYTACASMEGTS